MEIKATPTHGSQMRSAFLGLPVGQRFKEAAIHPPKTSAVEAAIPCSTPDSDPESGNLSFSPGLRWEIRAKEERKVLRPRGSAHR